MKALLDLFLRHRNRETGVWSLGQDPQRIIFLEHGLLAFAQSTHPLDKLTTLLVERGKLTQDQMDYALQNLKPGLSIGRNLIELGFITQRDLLEVAKAQVERVVWGAMGNMDDEPRFQAHDLDASVVRLSLDTPLTLLVGCLHLRDRERLLELLGPLDQKLQLESKVDLNLPPDLAKIPPLLNGQRRLLDLAQEAGVEPIRVGAFALFLREMGLARLHFGPPPILPEPPQVEIPAPQPPAISPLVASIEAAQHPTMDLNHLSGQLDEMELTEPLDLSDELPPITYPNVGQDLALNVAAEEIVDAPRASGPAPSSPRRMRGWFLSFLLIGSLAVYGGWRWIRRAAVPMVSPIHSTVVPESEVLTQKPTPRDLPSAPSSASLSLPAAAPPPTPSTTVQAPPPSVPKSAEHPTGEGSESERWKTLRKGDWEMALAQGSAHRKALKDAWVLRLEVACQADTIARAVAAFPQPADLFLVPMTMKDGRTCRQVCLGHFKSEAEAQAALTHLPTLFNQGGNKPKPFQASSLPENQ